MEEQIVKELLSTTKYLRKDEKNSKWYREYLDKVNSELKALSMMLFLFLFSCAEKDYKQEIPFYQVKEQDLQMIDVINEYRQQNGKNILFFSQELCNVANTVNQCSHAYFDNRAQYVEPHYLSECLACNYSSINSAFFALKNSEKHDKVLLDSDLTEIGVASKTDLIILEFTK